MWLLSRHVVHVDAPALMRSCSRRDVLVSVLLQCGPGGLQVLNSAPSRPYIIQVRFSILLTYAPAVHFCSVCLCVR